MIIEIIAIIFIAIIGIIIAVLNKKSIERHNSNTELIESVIKANAQLQQKCDSLSTDLTDLANAEKENTHKIASSNLDIVSNTRKIKSIEGEFDNRLNKAKDETEKAIEHINEMHNQAISQLEERIKLLTSILNSLSDDNNHLQEALREQKKKLDFYLNIDQDAEGLTVNEDIEEQKNLIEKAKDQLINANRNYNSTLPISEAPTAVPVEITNKIISPSQDIKNSTEEFEENTNIILDNEQKFANNFMNSSNENVFITGKAGTGKSFLLEIFRSTTNKKTIVLAPTGIAALNVGGATLHSTFGYYNLVNLDVDSISESTIKLKSEKKLVLRQVNTIIIDEISMVRADTFDKIDHILRVINGVNTPFGGKQMLIFGDLFQLPPIVKGKEYDYLLDRYGGRYFFHSNAYKNGNFQFIELNVNHRQKDDKEYFEVLNRIREGKTTDNDIDLLNTRYTPNEDVYDRFVYLFPKKAEAERVNREHIDQLDSKEFIYQAQILFNKTTNNNKNLENIFPIVDKLRLKLGASVMMVANDPEHRWVNGSLGIVKTLSQDNIYISFGKNRVFEVHPFEFDEQEITYSDGKINYEKVFSVSQYPIVPAYAITIHKSQGQTYSNIACDIDNCFETGQAYVALSRCASLSGLHLKSKITPVSIKVDSEILDFYNNQLSKNALLQPNTLHS